VERGCGGGRVLRLFGLERLRAARAVVGLGVAGEMAVDEEMEEYSLSLFPAEACQEDTLGLEIGGAGRRGCL